MAGDEVNGNNVMESGVSISIIMPVPSHAEFFQVNNTKSIHQMNNT